MAIDAEVENVDDELVRNSRIARRKLEKNQEMQRRKWLYHLMLGNK